MPSFDLQQQMVKQGRGTLRAYSPRRAQPDEARPGDRYPEDTTFTLIARRDHFC